MFKIESKLSKNQRISKNFKNFKMKLSATILGALAVANADDDQGKFCDWAIFYRNGIIF